MKININVIEVWIDLEVNGEEVTNKCIVKVSKDGMVVVIVGNIENVFHFSVLILIHI